MSRPVIDLQLCVRRGAFARTYSLRSQARVLALTGPSGAGKTTLLHAIAGIIRPTEGHLHWQGQTWFDRQRGIDVPAHRRRVGYVFQDGRLFPHLRVAANLDFGSRYSRHLQAHFERDTVVELLALAALLDRPVDGLSGGERQRVAIGRALLAQPQLLLLDEPLSSIDRDHAEQLLPYLIRLRDDIGVPMIYVSHHRDEVARLAQEVFALG